MDVTHGLIVVGVADNVVEPAIVAFLAQLKEHILRFDVLNKVPDHHGIFCDGFLLINGHFLLLPKEVFLNTYCEDLLPKVVQLNQVLRVLLQILFFSF